MCKGASLGENKLAVALAVRAAMRAHRQGRPIAFGSSYPQPAPQPTNKCASCPFLNGCLGKCGWL